MLITRKYTTNQPQRNPRPETTKLDVMRPPLHMHVYVTGPVYIQQQRGLLLYYLFRVYNRSTQQLYRTTLNRTQELIGG